MGLTVRQQIGNIVESVLGDGGEHMLEVGMKRREFRDKLVSKTLQALEALGVERQGGFQDLFGKPRHVTLNEHVRVRVPLTGYGLDETGDVAPAIQLKVSYGESQPLPPIIYHTHPQGDTTPSAEDVKYMRARGDDYILIASRQTDGTYQVTEWHPVKDRPAPVPHDADGAFGWIHGKPLEEYMKKHFTRRDYTLKKEGDRIIFGEAVDKVAGTGGPGGTEFITENQLPPLRETLADVSIFGQQAPEKLDDLLDIHDGNKPKTLLDFMELEVMKRGESAGEEEVMKWLDAKNVYSHAFLNLQNIETGEDIPAIDEQLAIYDGPSDKQKMRTLARVYKAARKHLYPQQTTL